MNQGVLVGFQVKLEKCPSALCDTNAVIKRANHRLRNDRCKYIRHVSARLPVEGGEGEGEGEVVCGQVWWPILGICPLHLTHPSAHSQQWTHTWSSGQPYCGARGAVGGSVPCSRVSPQSWYWRWREHLLFTPPHLQSLPDLGIEPATFGLQVQLSNH